MRGRLSEISIVGLIKTFHEGRQSGRLRLGGDDGEAELYFEEGDLVAVNLSCPISADGPYDIFRWRDGEFEFELFAPAPGRDFDVPVEIFLARGEECERRWQAFAPLALEGLAVVHAAEPAPDDDLAPAEAELLALVRGAEHGMPLLSVARRSERGLLETAERVAALYRRGWVTFESARALQLSGAVQEALNAVLGRYRTFAGKTLTGQLVARIEEYTRRLELPVARRGEEMVVAAEPSRRESPGLWRSLFSFIVSEMSGPIGVEAARLLWRQALDALEPAAAAVLARHRLDATR
jgi:hypothetical protein